MITPDLLYQAICTSIIKVSEDFRKANMPASSYVDWDAHAQVNELPQTSVLGPAGIGMTTENDGSFVAFSIGASTLGDPNLFQLRAVMSKLYGLLAPETKLNILHPTTGAVVGWMVVKTPVQITPVSKAEIRSVQFINVLALIGHDVTSPLRS
jgi:hypothetical protein